MVSFPAPVGGTVIPDDFAPSVLFTVLYASLVGLVFHRIFCRRTRSVVLMGTLVFSVERIILYNLRNVQAKSEPFSVKFVTYQQISLGMGFIAIASDAVRLVRCLLVNATYGPENYSQSPAAATKEGVVSPPSADTPDLPQARSWHRLATSFLSLAFLAAFITGIAANSNYSKNIDSQSNADLTGNARAASTAIALGLSIFVVHVTFRGFLKLPRVSKRGVVIIGVIFTLIIMISTYRLSVMWLKVTSITVPSPHDTPSSKALFYVFHALPEWVATVILIWDDIPETFGTGLFGDWRLWDETEKDRMKRLDRGGETGGREKMQLVHSQEVEMKGQV